MEISNAGMIEIDFPEKLSRFQFPTYEADATTKEGKKEIQIHPVLAKPQ